MGRKQAAAANADVPIQVISSSLASGSGASRSGPSELYSALQVVQGLFYGVPILPVMENGLPAGADGVQMMHLVVQGDVRHVTLGTTNTYLRDSGRIPMIWPGAFDLNAPPKPEVTGQPQAMRRPVMCFSCDTPFCFGQYDLDMINPPPGFVYQKLPVPATADVVTPPPPEPLTGYGAAPAGFSPLPVLVCSDRRHFALTMGVLNLASDSPLLLWKRPWSMGVLPIAGAVTPHVDEPEPEDCSSSSN
ncbi:hypothetical protein ACP70R_027687 [Stipagrostis hirtigluma subsp. patula]